MRGDRKKTSVSLLDGRIVASFVRRYLVELVYKSRTWVTSEFNDMGYSLNANPAGLPLGPLCAAEQRRPGKGCGCDSLAAGPFAGTAA